MIQISPKSLAPFLIEIHEDLDAAVAEAYGWPAGLDEQDILQRLVDLNHERAAEEAEGHIRYLRPDYQNPQGPKEEQGQLISHKDTKNTKPKLLRSMPRKVPEGLEALAAEDDQSLTDWSASNELFLRKYLVDLLTWCDAQWGLGKVSDRPKE